MKKTIGNGYQDFSVKYAGRSDLFEGLSVWKQEEYHRLQGTYPVISISFANVKETNYRDVHLKICQLITELYNKYVFLKKWEGLEPKEKEVFAVFDEYGMSDQKEKARFWYDGFIFGDKSGIYNPWSVINFLDTGKFAPYWANTSANSLVGKLIREGSSEIKQAFEKLLASGYLKVQKFEIVENSYGEWEDKYEPCGFCPGHKKKMLLSWNLKCITPRGKKRWKRRCRQPCGK